MEAAGVEPAPPQNADWLMTRDFRRTSLAIRCPVVGLLCLGVLSWALEGSPYLETLRRWPDRIRPLESLIRYGPSPPSRIARARAPGCARRRARSPPPSRRLRLSAPCRMFSPKVSIGNEHRTGAERGQICRAERGPSGEDPPQLQPAERPRCRPQLRRPTLSSIKGRLEGVVRWTVTL